jgi:plasmid stabilization system protein ParE
MGVFDVRFSAAADEDLGRLLGLLLDRAKTVEDLHEAEIAIGAIRTAVFSHLAHTPYSFRKAGRSSTRRELIIPFGATGYVALFEIVDLTLVLVLAVRHQREADYH